MPPYCPDENRIERLWKDLHDNVTRNHTCTTMDKLMRCVNDYLDGVMVNIATTWWCAPDNLDGREIDGK